MKTYHTQILINAPIAKVWKHLTDFASYPQWNPLVGKLEGKIEVGQKISTYIIPLGKTYYPELLVVSPQKELTWQGYQGAKFLMAGKHYYQLKAVDAGTTQLLHGEYFTGIFSYFIPLNLLQKMENAFILHNQLLKERIENEK